MAKTDEKAAPSTPQMAISADVLENLGQTITGIDLRIVSASGSDSQAKRAFVESIVAKHTAQAEETSTNLIAQLRELEPEMLVALVTALQDDLKTELQPVVDGWVDEEFPKTQTESKEDVAALREERKTLVGHFKAMRELLNAFKIPNEHVLDPKRVGGGRPAGSGGGGDNAKSGKNKEGYRYIMDGKERPPSQNSFSSLAYYSTAGVPKALNPDSTIARWGAKELKAHIAEKGINFGADGDNEWTVELPNGKTIGARRLTPQDLTEFGIDESADTNGDAATEDATVAA